MAGLCEGGNESPGSLKASAAERTDIGTNLDNDTRKKRRQEDKMSLENKVEFRITLFKAIDAVNWSGRKIRKHLRNDAFQTWRNHTLRGKGVIVIVYSDLPKANSWVSNRKGLSSSEWTNALKCQAIFRRFAQYRAEL
ncbi:hypothetical protein ANN_20102 [Periplaneta americana]|uniref:Uncharacterized protein n=1 Tax=Periplaneta americana TaxID=6978 RepID=A0ABQ8SBP4_PERAM|nr:hypothetical protein ANN_20102 [Periplaneta americana]